MGDGSKRAKIIRRTIWGGGLAGLLALALWWAGASDDGLPVALVDYTTTTGGSTLQAAEIVRAAGGDVRRVICLVDRGEGAREAFAAADLELEAVIGREDLPI